jgi:hypothetical protein
MFFDLYLALHDILFPVCENVISENLTRARDEPLFRRPPVGGDKNYISS